MPPEERQVEAQVFVTHLFCDIDHVEMKYTEKTFQTQPPKFEYQCPKCKKKQISTVRYPYVTYKAKEKK